MSSFGQGDQLSSRIWSMEKLVDIKAGMRNLMYYVMYYVICDTQSENWTNLIKVTYNGTIYVIASRCYKLNPYLCPYN